MRILLACELYAPTVGGIQEVMRQVAERLVERGHRVTVATTHLSERRAREINGVNVAEFKVSGNLVRGLKGEVDAYRRYVLESDYDLFMVKSAQQWTFDALVPVLDRMTKPKVFIPCGFSCMYEPSFAEYYKRMPELLRKFDHLIFYASAYRDIDFARSQGITSLTVLSNGADEREFQVAAHRGFRQEHGIPEDAFVMLTVGSLSGMKGHRELLEAFTRMHVPSGRPAVLILNANVLTWMPLRPSFSNFPSNLRHLYNGGGLRSVLSWLIKPVLVRAGFGKVLQALGYGAEPPLQDVVARVNRLDPLKHALLIDLPRAELVQAYLNSDLFVLASNIEYSPLVLFEAAAAGLPFLAVPVGNAEEIARWTGAGEICPAPLDARGYTRAQPQVLADHMQALAANRRRLKQMGEAGRRNWLDRFTWAKIADQYEALFERVIVEKSPNAGADSRPVAAGRSGTGA